MVYRVVKIRTLLFHEGAMKALLYIVIAAVLMSGSGSRAFAYFEASAVWERDEDARLWGERITSGIRAIDESIMRMGSHCDKRTFAEMRRLKDAAIMELRSCAGAESEYARFLRLVIGNIERIEISRNDHASREHNDFHAGASGYSLPREVCGELPSKKQGMIGAGMVPVLTRGGGRSHHSKMVAAHLNGRFEDSHRLNPCVYSFDREKVDYFRLFLYLWEDTPWDIPGEDIPPSRNSFPSLPTTSSRTIQNKFPCFEARAAIEHIHTRTRGPHS